LKREPPYLACVCGDKQPFPFENTPSYQSAVPWNTLDYPRESIRAGSAI
jgi:hypothetical protein